MISEVSNSQEEVDSSERKYSPATFAHFLTPIVIRSLCPLLRSEIMFGDFKLEPGEQKFAHWIEKNLSGDLNGKVALACENHVLESLATGLNVRDQKGFADLPETLARVFASLCNEISSQLKKDEFDCQMQSDSDVLHNHTCRITSNESAICPIETKFGVINFVISFCERSGSLLESLYGARDENKARKIRVSASHLDSLLERVSIVENLEERLLEGPQVRSKLRTELRVMKRIVEHLRAEPIELLFMPARRLITEICKSQGKQISLSTQGTWLYMDKNTLNYLYSPILHLVRNAADHGIEEPRERERLGKPAVGYVKCMASFSSEGLRLIVSDDGRGLDLEKIRNQAVSKGLLSEEDAIQKVPIELASLIFEPGFSTRDRTDAISGSGLGLEIVRQEIEKLSGKIRILSTSHYGTSFEIFVPIPYEQAIPKAPAPRAEAEKEDLDTSQNLYDEMGGYFDRLLRLLAEDPPPTDAGIYESHRLINSIKGIAGYLGWNRVVTFCTHFEDYLKSISNGQLERNESRIQLMSEALDRLGRFCDASQKEENYPLFEIRQTEGKILRNLWMAQKEEETPRFSFGRIHLRTIREAVTKTQEEETFRYTKETEISRAVKQPYGALLQFEGSRQGFGGVFLAESGVKQLLTCMEYDSFEASLEDKLLALKTFAASVGTLLVRAADQEKVELKSSVPISFYGKGDPLRIFGTPTYCYRCELAGSVFYIAGDSRMPHSSPSAKRVCPSLADIPISTITNTISFETVEHFKSMGREVLLEETHTQSDVVGFESGVTFIVGLSGVTNVVVFLSFEEKLVNSFMTTSTAEEKKSALNELLSSINQAIGKTVSKSLGQHKIKLALNPPSLFLGKAYFSTLNHLVVTNKITAQTPEGNFEIRTLID